MVSLSWAEGDALYRAGESAQHLFVLVAGRVKLSQPTSTGTAVVTDVITPGRLFGAMSTLGQPVHDETAQALVTSCALRIGQQAFRAVVSEHPQVALRVLAGLTRSTPESVSRVMSRLRKDGIIGFGRRWTAILDRPRLGAVAGHG